MPKAKRPRFGSMQYWPRKRAKRPVARVRSWATAKDAKPLAFAGYKAGMTHITATDNRKSSTSKNQEITIPVTIIECPPMRIYSVRAYKPHGYGVAVSKEVIINTDKDLARKLTIPKNAKHDINAINPEEAKDITIIAYTQPKKIGFKKKPDLFEIKLGGTNEEKLAYVKEHANKEITAQDLLREGDLIDLHAITTGKGFQGAVKRFGIGLKPHKSEKGRRTPGSLGGWSGQAHFMYRIAHAGQMGYHQRTQYNNAILKISDAPEEVNQAGGITHYGNVKNTYLLIKGTVPGPKKRLVIMAKAIRQKKKQPAPTVKAINKDSKQGR
ncbi:50S ribosomal protein L3 [Candidatus Woesearchaeota archaeon]|nr:50S ribosomal protein L3 [Candidatus Woesearchaeota archaeon]